jgi:hypothetical protein
MSEFYHHDEIEQISRAMYEECRSNAHIYDSPSGIEVQIGGIGWAVTYWPPSSTSKESLSLTRDWPELRNPVSYHVCHDGNMTRNDKVIKGVLGGVYFDANSDERLTDLHEARTLQSIVIAAHQINS